MNLIHFCINEETEVAEVLADVNLFTHIIF